VLTAADSNPRCLLGPILVCNRNTGERGVSIYFGFSGNNVLGQNSQTATSVASNGRALFKEEKVLGA